MEDGTSLREVDQERARGTCSFVHARLGLKCEREVEQGDLCVFHTASTNSSAFRVQLQRLINSNDGYWAGFVFPKDFAFEDTKFPFQVDLRHATFERITFTKCSFSASVNFSEAQFAANVVLETCEFEDRIDCSHAIGLLLRGERRRLSRPYSVAARRSWALSRGLLISVAASFTNRLNSLEDGISSRARDRFLERNRPLLDTYSTVKCTLS